MTTINMIPGSNIKVYANPDGSNRIDDRYVNENARQNDAKYLIFHTILNTEKFKDFIAKIIQHNPETANTKQNLWITEGRLFVDYQTSQGQQCAEYVLPLNRKSVNGFHISHSPDLLENVPQILRKYDVTHNRPDVLLNKEILDIFNRSVRHLPPSHSRSRSLSPIPSESRQPSPHAVAARHHHSPEEGEHAGSDIDEEPESGRAAAGQRRVPPNQPAGRAEARRSSRRSRPSRRQAPGPEADQPAGSPLSPRARGNPSSTARKAPSLLSLDLESASESNGDPESRRTGAGQRTDDRFQLPDPTGYISFPSRRSKRGNRDPEDARYQYLPALQGQGEAQPAGGPLTPQQGETPSLAQSSGAQSGASGSGSSGMQAMPAALAQAAAQPQQGPLVTSVRGKVAAAKAALADDLARAHETARVIARSQWQNGEGKK